jgi:hypothetical protein
MQHLLDLIANVVRPWTDYYASSAGTETAVMFLHLGGMVAAGGIAFTLDRAVLRSGRAGWPRRGDLAQELHHSHTAVIAGLMVVLVSGIALTAADPTVFLVSWIYWAKMVTVVFLLANGWTLKRSGEALLADPESEGAFLRLRRSALRSAGLWALAVLGGVAITMYA